MASFLITGASRGFGLALVRLLSSLPSSEVGKVFACPRGTSPELEELAKDSDRVVIVKLDVTNQESIAKAVIEVEKKLEGKGLDVLINNAGICQYAPDGVKSMDNLEESFTVNVMGVHWVTRAFLPLLYKGNNKKVANIATTLGSITLARAAHYLPAPAYKISKAAMDALTVQYALDYEKDGFTFMALCPGWMKTDLGGGDMADLTPEEGAKASLDIIFKPGQDFNGRKCPRFWLRAGREPKATTSTMELMFHGDKVSFYVAVASLLEQGNISIFLDPPTQADLINTVLTATIQVTT